MAAWIHTHPFPSGTTADIVVARVRASDGVLLDPGATAVGQAPTSGVVGDRDIAFDGSRFIVVWDSLGVCG